MIKPESFIQQAGERGFQFYTGVPCSYIKPLINYVIDSPDLNYIGAANEGDAAAIAAGVELAGKRCAVMMQNSGLGNAVNPLTSLNAVFQIPVLLIVTWRGEPDGVHDEPQHELMGRITTKMLDLLGIPWMFFPSSEDAVGPALDKAVNTMSRTGLPFGLVMKKDTVSPYSLKTELPEKSLSCATIYPWAWPGQRPTRAEALGAVQRRAAPEDAVIATTGYTGRALWALEDRPNQFYMVGSMGCASSLGLGLAWAEPQRKIIVLDGDGALLMRLGALSTIGYQSPSNLVHVLLDNELHESTGGQATVSHAIDLAAVASACGYKRVIRAASTMEIEQAIAESGSELTFIHVKTRAGEEKNLPRPDMPPTITANRFRSWLHSKNS